MIVITNSTINGFCCMLILLLIFAGEIDSNFARYYIIIHCIYGTFTNMYLSFLLDNWTSLIVIITSLPQKG